MRNGAWIFAMAWLLLIASHCGGSNPVGEKPTDDSGVTPAGIGAVVDGNNQFALDVYSELRASDDGNIFLSPYSLSAALAMTYEGARGQTAQEIANVFHFPADDAQRRAAFAALHNQLNGDDGKYQLDVANALWAQKDYGFLDTYINTLITYYAARAASVDFSGDTEGARQTINAWVAEKTQDKIKELFPKGVLNEVTRLVLTNAVYFKGQWVTPFDKNKTQDGTFHLNSDQTVTVPMMRLTGEGAEFKYAEDEKAQVLELPYAGDRLSMVVLLPREGEEASFEETLSPAKLDGWRNALAKQRVDVFLPKFTFSTQYAMKGVLQNMGMPTAFTGAADFSGMDGTRDLVIQAVIHQAFVDVNEEGTEAAAATGVVVGRTSVGPSVPVFRADRPFLFVIEDIENGTILFLGRVVNPKA